MNELIYVYCLSDSLPDPGCEKISQGLISVPAGAFYAVVKPVSEAEFSEENLKINLSDIQWLESNVREHVAVISMIMEQNTVIPFKFGTIFNNENSLLKFVEDYEESLVGNMLYIEWKEEWSVKIYCDRKVLTGQIDELSEDAASLEQQIMASSPGKAFLLKRKKTDLIENEMDRLCKKYGQGYFNEFNRLSVSVSLNNLLPKELTGRNEEMILNAAFLISKERAIDFISTARTLKKLYSSLGFYLELTGPWPPFSFISIKEKS